MTDGRSPLSGSPPAGSAADQGGGPYRVMVCDDSAVIRGLISRNLGEALCFCPPLIITATQLDDMFGCVRRALDRVAKTRT